MLVFLLVIVVILLVVMWVTKRRRKFKTKYFNKIWVINLDSRPDKMQFVDKTLKRLGMNYTRFSAKVGVKNDQLTGGEVGCILSHRTLWQQLLDDTSTYWYLIFEDDIYVPDDIHAGDFEYIMDAALRKNPTLEMIAFGHCGCDGTEVDIFRDTTDRMVLKNGYIYCTHAYAINKKGAMRLLSGDNRGVPIDNYMKGVYQSHPDKVYRVFNSIRNNMYMGEGIVYQNRGLASDIRTMSQGLMKCRI